MDRIEIDKRITSTEKQTVATVFGCSKRHVEYVLQGDRNNPEILKMCEKIVTEREKLTESLQKQIQNNRK